MLSMWIKAAMISAAVIVGVASRFIFKKKPDNNIEQIMESIIKEETGIEIDLSPDVKEEDGNNKLD